ncbi:MAG: TonB-dependent receptor [Bacteroidales bacterium]|nr:TonB-dependent receptor [Bacteroidales bacterium]
MRFRSAVVAILVLIAASAAAQENYIIDWDYSGEQFESFVQKAEAAHNIKFFYEKGWINDIVLGDYPGKKVLGEILDSLFAEKDIYWYEFRKGSIILTKSYVIKLAGEAPGGGGKYIPGPDRLPGTGSVVSQGNLVTVIGNPAGRDIPGDVMLSGYITNEDTREPVAGATIYIAGLSSGTISNQYGFYRLIIPKGSHQVRFSFVGMKEKTVELNIFDQGELNIEMKNVLVPLKEAVITAEKDVTVQRFEVGVEKVNVTSFRLMPTSMGESDIVKSILLVPGVNTIGEGSAGFNVRGGSADQNLILLYGAPLYNSNHFFGFFSAVNPDIIRDVTLYKGGIPGRFGGRLSSVLEIVPREGNRREFAGNAGISPVTAHFSVEGPIKKDTLFYLLTGRTTYSDWILRAVENTQLNNSSASFNDLNARIAWDPGRKNKIDLSAYYSHDAFRLNSDTSYKYMNSIVSARWRHYFTSMFFSSLTVNNSYYKYNISSVRVPEEAFSLIHSINSTGLKAEFNLFKGRSEFNFGSELTRYNVVPGNYRPADDSSLVLPNSIQNQRAIEGSVWLEDKYTLTDYLSLNAGLRFSTFFALGPQTVFIYNPESSRSLSSVMDTVSFKRSGIYRKYSGPEIRLSANFRLGDYSSLKLNYNHTRQYLHQLSNTTSIAPTDIWKLSDYYLKPQTGEQFAAGYYRIINRNKVEFSAEIYYKIMENLTDFKGGTNLVMNECVERDLVNVRGKAYGIELLLKKPEGRIRWSAGYTYSRVLLKSTGSFRDEIINSGKWFSASFDRPHDLVLTLNCIWSRRVSLSANYDFSSGRPVTYPVTSYKIGDIIINHYSDRNSYRIPYYSRLDLSVKISGTLKSKKIAQPHWIFSIYNVFGRDNVYSAYFRNVNNTVRGYYLSIFSKPIPSLSFNFDF